MRGVKACTTNFAAMQQVVPLVCVLMASQTRTVCEATIASFTSVDKAGRTYGWQDLKCNKIYTQETRPQQNHHTPCTIITVNN